MERGPRLRAVSNRKIKCEGGYTLSRDKTCLIFPEFEVIDEAGKARKVLPADGEVVTFRSTTPFTMTEHIGFVRVNKDLYAMGTIMNVLPLVSPTDGQTVVEFTFKPNTRVDVSKLSHLFELYVGA